MYTMLPGMSAILSTDTLESNLQRQVKTILPDIRIGSEDGNASPAQIRTLIDELISDDRMLLMLDQVWQGERILAAELEHELDGAEPLMWWPIRPAIRMTSYRMMLHANAAGEQFKSSPTPYAGPSVFPSQPTFVPPLYRLTHMDSQIQFFSIQWTRLLAGDRSVPKALGILLAIQLYRFDHGGALPESLEEMVPAYFAEVPIDPESAARFQYARDGLPFSEGQPVVFINPGNMTIPTTAPQVSPQHSQFKFWTAEPLSTEPPSDE